MSKELKVWAIFALVAFAVWGCSEQQPAPQLVMQQPMQVMPQMPVAPQPVVAPPPPPTPVMPISDVPAAPEPTAGKGGKGGGGGGSVDKPIPGQKTAGDELLGNYACKLESPELQVGPFKLPEFGCAIRKNKDDALIVTSGGSATSLSGNVQDQTAVGFFIVGNFKFPGNEMDIKVRMIRQGTATVFSGKGKGTLNKDNKKKTTYKLTMTKK